MELSLNGEKYQLKQLNFNFEIFSLADLEYKEFNKFVLRFHSPTFVRQQNITYMLPNPSQFLFSVYQKLISYCPDLKIENEKDFKEWLKYQLYVGEFDLSSRLITLKKGKKA
ncbi:MAG: hypothetical protein K6E76_00275 [Patescibacteria group bacterium]|nr:hypothetical protein [Patescibacteria group bacterium]